MAVFGVADIGKIIVGTYYRSESRAKLDSLKAEIAKHTTGGLSFIEIYEVERDGKRVVMFEIPPAPQGFPVAWQQHYYGRNGEELGGLNIDEFERIRRQSITEDWSIGICEEATISDLDPAAIAFARQNFIVKNPRLSGSVVKWTNKKGNYIRNRGLKNDIYKDMVLKMIGKFGNASRQDINQLLFDVLPDILTPVQKSNKIRNIVSQLSTESKIENNGSSRYPKWQLRKV